MSKQVFATDKAPKAIGPYSQAIGYSDLIFVSGQTPIDPDTGEIVAGFAAQTRRCLDNISAILAAAGSGWDKVLKTTIFLMDMKNFSIVNEIYLSYLTGSHPARSTVQVAGLPMGADIEIEVIAAR